MPSFRDQVNALRGEHSSLKTALLSLNSDSDPSRGTTYFVDTADGANGNDGKSWDRPFLTMAKAFTTVRSGDTIRFRGKVTEELTTPAQVFDVTVIGDANRPRHADTTPVDIGGRTHGASWGVPGTPTSNTPLVKVQNQGWTFANILFDAHSDSPAVQLFSDAGSGNDERDASHASFYGCRFTGSQEGIESVGGQVNVLIDDCQFVSLTTAIVSTNTAVRVCQDWTIRNCRINTNTNHITLSLVRGQIGPNNNFGKFTTRAIDLTHTSGQGSDNDVFGNYLSGTYAHAAYQDATGDSWRGNFTEAGVTAANPAA